MENLKLWNRVKDVPENCKKRITGGRLKDMTDIKPIWRIEKLTEEFGPCGLGWAAEITDINAQEYNDEAVITVRIKLYVKYGEEWSRGIDGVGSSKIAAQESGGLYVDDEAVKKAYTDALSVACRSLGIGATVYYGDNSGSKYEEKPEEDFGETVIKYDKDYGGKRLKDLNTGELNDLLARTRSEWLKTRVQAYIATLNASEPREKLPF